MAVADSSLSINLLLDERPRQPPDTTTRAGKPPGGPPEGATGVSQHEPIKGYNKAVLIEAVPPKILCVSCDLILRDPIQSQCGHRYCRQCYTRVVEAQPGVQCGACTQEGEGEGDRSSLTLNSIIPDHAIRRDMAEMGARCDNSGCDWIGTFGNYLKHEPDCDYRKHKCECDMLVSANKMAEHKKKECCRRIIKCLFCPQDLVAKDKEEHESSCEFFPKICNGCGSKMPRLKIASHVDPIRGDCKNRKCPFDCDVVNSLAHQKEKVIDHLNALLGKVVTLTSLMEEARGRSQAIDAEVLGQKVGDLLTKVTEIHHQAAAMAGNTTLQSMNETGAGSGHNANIAALTEKQSTVESLVAILNRQLEKIIVEYNGLEHQRRLQSDSADTLQRKVTSLERSVAMKDIALAEMDLRIQALEKTTFDGVLVWPITDLSRKREDAVSGRTLSIYSPPFYTSRCGYKMCCRLYLNGDGMGKGTHLSLFFVVMRGQYDAILPWPFRQKVTLMLLDHGNKDHLIDAFRPDPSSTSFRRPVSDMNIASGCPLFCPLGTLEDRKPAYVKDDAIFIKVIVDQSGI